MADDIDFRAVCDELAVRTNGYRNDGEAQPLLAPEAAAAAEMILARRAEAGDFELVVVAVVAWFHWQRSLALPDGEGDPDWGIARDLFAELAPLLPDFVPDEFRGVGRVINSRPQLALLDRALRRLPNAIDAGGSSLDEVIDLLARGTPELTSDSPGYPAVMSNYGVALRTRFEQSGSTADLDEAIRVSRDAANRASDDHPDRAALHANLALALLGRFTIAEDRADLDEAIGAQDQAVDGSSGDRHRLVLAQLLSTRFRLLGLRDDIDRAVRVARDAVSGAPSSSSWAVLGQTLADRFDISNDLVDLDEGLRLLREAARAMGSDDPDLAGVLTSRVDALRTRFERCGRSEDLDEAVRIAGEAVDASASDDARRGASLSCLARVLLRRFEVRGLSDDLDTAVECGRAAVTITPFASVNRAPRLSTLAASLLSRYDQSGAGDDLAAALEAAREALDACPPDSPHRADYLSELAIAWQASHEQTGLASDLDEAVRLGRLSVLEDVGGGAEGARRRSNLATILLSRFMSSGSLDDLDRTIELAELASRACVPGNPARGTYLNNWASGLLLRAIGTGARADLDEAVRVAREAVAATADGHVEHAKHWATLGAALQHQFRRTDNFGDLEDALAACRQAADSVGSRRPDRIRYWSNLAAALRARFDHTEDRRDIDEAIALGRRCLDTFVPGGLGTIALGANLASALLTRYREFGDERDVDHAVQAARQAADVGPPDHPDRGIALLNLGNALHTRREAGDREAAYEAWRAAAALRATATQYRFSAAIAWGLAAAEDGSWTLAADGYGEAVGLLPLLAWQGARRTDAEESLTRAAGMVSDAASCAVAAGDPDRALEIIEAGRGVLWSHQLDSRTDLGEVRAVAPELAAELADVRAALDELGDDLVTLLPAVAGDAGRRAALSRRWDELVARVRELPGLAGFLRAPSAEQLRQRTVGGTAAIPIVSRWRCDALLVTPDAVKALPLPGLTKETVTEHIDDYLLAIQRFESGPRSPRDRTMFEAAISRSLEWLWDAIAEPILSAAGLGRHVDGSDWPRVWWCPTGPLSLLPIHAAGRHRDGVAGYAVLDCAISSYTPTLRILDPDLRENVLADSDGTARRLLVVGMPSTPGASELPTFAVERDLLTRLMPGRTTVLEGPAATRSAVNSLLDGHRWAHFTCHGTQDLAQPGRGGLVLHDGRLTVTEMRRSAAQAGEVVVLAACKTATGGLRLSDEAITLAAAFRYHGWRHVVGTLWSVWDVSTAMVTTDMWTRLQTVNEGSEDTAGALHHAVRALREKQAGNPSLWALIAHYGH
ncbi:CHAT domain-containing protein [Cryptosporangium arvum]|uniref:CHAT domain-containing protein n=1 Tax=Cryptosporangium arvum DSM 44712 TaxID=927661 RepID=A0A010ZV74_9ACTN|nr:CHAT domain-containing protein [Cryptosporangium arvum]EXG81112.1 hypothetical protein CryarDRAFT_2209 [Cryptosporangium arvum DSM 44712]